MWLGGDAWLGAGCALGGTRAPLEALLGRVLDAFGEGHYGRDPDGPHARDCTVTAHAGQRVQLLLDLAGAQAFPETTTVWLPEAEALYGMPARFGETDAQRRARYAARRRGTDGRVETIRAAAREIAPTAETFTTSWQTAQAYALPLLTMRLGLLIEDSWADARATTDVIAVVRRQLPSHWTTVVGRRQGFRCNASALRSRPGGPDRRRGFCDTDLLAF